MSGVDIKFEVNGREVPIDKIDEFLDNCNQIIKKQLSQSNN